MNKSTHIKPQYLDDPIYYRKAKSDYALGILGFIIICGVMSALILATILVGLPEQ
jgi:hypothetical protein